MERSVRSAWWLSIVVAGIGVMILLAGLVGIAHAQGAEAAFADDVIGELVKAFIGAAQAGDYREAAAVLFIAVVWALRKLPIAWLKTDEGGSLLVLLTATAVALLAAVRGDVTLDWSAWRGALTTGVLAAGGYSVLWRRLAAPLLAAGLAKLPWAWAARAAEAIM